jgi:hypothetical protein
VATTRRSPKQSILVVAALAASVLVAAPAATALAKRRSPAPHVSSVKCWPSKACGYHPHVASPGRMLRFKGRNLRTGMVVLFPRRRLAKATSATVSARLRRRNGLVATVPPLAKSGRIRVATRNGRRSNAVGPIRIVRPVNHFQASRTALDGTGMWIWYVSRSSGGDPAAIATQAARYGVRTVFVKSSDGTTWWPQFSAQLVAALKFAGLHVCAWQFVYGSRPQTEADLGGRAAATGADCLVIDAESAYEGKYAQAQAYVEALRAQVGPTYTIGLAGFPYVDYQPAFPYSVFFEPGAAQYSLPQIYWRAIGTTVDRAFAHTYTWNSVYQRSTFPLGQLYGGARPPEIERFRQLASAYGASGLSWWSWQSASPAGWAAIDLALSPLAEPLPAAGYPTLARGTRGDVVVSAQERLTSTGQQLTVNGVYGSTTEQAVRNLQTTSGLPVTGRLDAVTWPVLLRFQPARVDWSKGARASAAVQRGRNGPRSAWLRSLRNELAAKSRTR